MLIRLFALALVSLLFLPAFPMESYGHRSGCHAAHSCPSDTGSYECGDTGNYSQCPGNHSEDDDEKPEIKKSSTTPKSNAEKSDLTLPSETFSEGIEISGPVTDVVDGDTLDINDIRIRLSLVNTPEIGEAGFVPAKEFVESLCLDKNGQVDIDDGQRQGSFGREIGVVYCDGINLNSELIKKGYALISAEFCEVSEFSAKPWAKSSCQMESDEYNNLLNNSNQNSDSLSQKQEQQAPFDSEFSGSNETQSYSNSKLGINLKHPADWDLANLKNGIQFIKEKNGVYVEVRKHNLESLGVPLKQYVGDYIKDRSSSREDFKLLNITETTISGNLPAYKAIYTFLKTENQNDFTTGGTTNKILRIWTFAQDNAYLVAYVADKDKYDMYLPIAEKIIASIEYIPIQGNDNFEEEEDDSSDSEKEDNNSDSKDEGDDSKDEGDDSKDEGDDSKDEGDDSKDEDEDKEDCDDSYPDVCIPSPPPDLDCGEISEEGFKVKGSDPHRFDGDEDGIGCE